MRALQKPVEMVVLTCGAITLGTAYYLLVLALPTWKAVPSEVFLPSFRDVILNIGLSQVVVSNIALVGCVVLFYFSRDWFWLIAVMLLLVSLPVTMFWMMPINLHFLEAAKPTSTQGIAEKLSSWGNYQILRLVSDRLAFAAMCKPVIWRQST